MKIFICSHSSGLKGPIGFLEDYLIRSDNDVFHLQNPLDIYHGKKTVFFKNKKNKYTKKRFGPGVVNLFFDFILSVLFMLNNSYDLFIGSSNFDTLSAILLRRMGVKKTNKIIYFSSDFSDNRFKNFLLDSIYKYVEILALKYSDIVVSNTKRAESKRFSFGLDRKKSIVIPNGVFLKNETFWKKEVDKDVFIYVGNVTKEHGIFDFVIKMKHLIKKLTVIGQGDQWEDLKKYCKEQSISSEFYFKLNHEKTIFYIQSFKGFGLAPYTNDASWTWYCSPLKVNEYIACGIPVIISNVPEIAMQIDEEDLGIVYKDLNFEQVKKAIKNFNVDSFNLKAKKFYYKYSYESLYKSLPINFL